MVVAPTLIEVDYWIRTRLQPEIWSVFIEDIAGGVYRLEQLLADDLMRVAELQADYSDLGLGMVDASVIAVCEKLGEEKVATLDRRHFGVVRCDGVSEVHAPVPGGAQATHDVPIERAGDLSGVCAPKKGVPEGLGAPC